MYNAKFFLRMDNATKWHAAVEKKQMLQGANPQNLRLDGGYCL
jgi:hypothetical protein